MKLKGWTLILATVSIFHSYADTTINTAVRIVRFNFFSVKDTLPYEFLDVSGRVNGFPFTLDSTIAAK
jgi:hypothetical protein